MSEYGFSQAVSGVRIVRCGVRHDRDSRRGRRHERLRRAAAVRIRIRRRVSNGDAVLQERTELALRNTVHDHVVLPACRNAHHCPSSRTSQASPTRGDQLFVSPRDANSTNAAAADSRCCYSDPHPRSSFRPRSDAEVQRDVGQNPPIVLDVGLVIAMRLVADERRERRRELVHRPAQVGKHRRVLVIERLVVGELPRAQRIPCASSDSVRF